MITIEFTEIIQNNLYEIFNYLSLLLQQVHKGVLMHKMFVDSYFKHTYMLEVYSYV